MRKIVKAVSIVSLILSFPTTSSAQSISVERLNDWEFRFYACKNVVMNAAIVARLLESRQITDQGGIDGLQSGLGTAIEDAVNKHEKSYQFLDGEALFISDLTFAVVSGMVDGGFELTDMQLMQSANDICISTIESIAN